jgi:hypothetical protein
MVPFPPDGYVPMKQRCALLWAGSGLLGLVLLCGLLMLTAWRGMQRPAWGQNTTLPPGGAPTALPRGGAGATPPAGNSLHTLPGGGSLSTLPGGGSLSTLPGSGGLTTQPADGAGTSGAAADSGSQLYRFGRPGAPERSFFRDVIVPLAAAIIGGLIVAAALLLSPVYREQRREVRYLRAELWHRQLALASDVAQRAYSAVEILQKHSPDAEGTPQGDASSELLLRQRMHEAQSALATLMPHARIIFPSEAYQAVVEMHDVLGSCDRGRTLEAYKRLVARLREDLSAEQAVRQSRGTGDSQSV